MLQVRYKYEPKCRCRNASNRSRTLNLQEEACATAVPQRHAASEHHSRMPLCALASKEVCLLHDPQEFLLVHLTIPVTIGLIDHLLKLLIGHALAQLLGHALQVLE